MYKLYHYKEIKYGFIVLCPDCNIGYLKNTIKSIDTLYPKAKSVVVLSESCKDSDFAEISKIKKTYKGNGIISMLNTGFKHGDDAWNFVVLTKGWIKNKLDIKYSWFIESEKDVLFPIVNRKLNFVEADINGALIHKKTFLEVGEFPDIKSVEVSKLFWTTKAIEKGCKFKGVIGARVF